MENKTSLASFHSNLPICRRTAAEAWVDISDVFKMCTKYPTLIRLKTLALANC